MFLPDKRMLQAYASSDRGQFRDENQDNFLILQPEKDRVSASSLAEETYHQTIAKNWPEAYIRVAVADGMGGHESGRQISEAVSRGLMRIPPRMTPRAMRSAIMELHRKLRLKFSSKSEKSPGTTLVMADMDRKSGKGVMLNIGDSRAFLLSRNQWDQMTHDHHISEFSWRDGEISREDYEKRLKIGDHRIAQALGFGAAGIVKDKNGNKPYRLDPGIRLDLKKELPSDLSQHADVFTFRFSPGDILMLASDGLWSTKSGDSWWKTASGELFSQDGVNQLVQNAVTDHEVYDNVTVVVCGFKSQAKQTY